MAIEKTKVLFVGLSNKVNLLPFDAKTNSGKVVDMITNKLDCGCFKINLINYAPLDENNKLRYPTKLEIAQSTPIFINYVNELNPDLIVSFGNIVSDTLRKIDVIKDKTIYKKHPSYIYVYKRKCLDEYVEDIISDIENI